jgi:hypothetical protein
MKHDELVLTLYKKFKVFLKIKLIIWNINIFLLPIIYYDHKMDQKNLQPNQGTFTS